MTPETGEPRRPFYEQPFILNEYIYIADNPNVKGKEIS